jgi:hypothetical protein
MNQENKNKQKDRVNFFRQVSLENQVVEMKGKEYNCFSIVRSFVFRLHMSIQPDRKEKKRGKQIDVHGVRLQIFT